MMDPDVSKRPENGQALAARLGELLRAEIWLPRSDDDPPRDTERTEHVALRTTRAEPGAPTVAAELATQLAVTPASRASATIRMDTLESETLLERGAGAPAAPEVQPVGGGGQRSRKWPLMLALTGVVAVAAGSRFIPTRPVAAGSSAIAASSAGEAPASASAMPSVETSLAIDCRLPSSQALPACVRPSSLDPGTLGSGPPLAMLAPSGTIFGGVVLGQQLLAGIGWGGENGQGFILAVSTESGARTVLSGQYDQVGVIHTRGAGPPFEWVRDVQRPHGSRPGELGPLFALTAPAPGRMEQGKNGELLSITPANRAPMRIVRVDPESGDRSLVWESGSAHHAKCMRTDRHGRAREALPVAHGFAVGADGSFYLSLNQNPEGVGQAIVRIDADGKRCTVISAWAGSNSAEDVGRGPTSVKKIRALRWSGDSLLALAWFGPALVRVDPGTGDRQVVSQSGKDGIADGPALGHEWLAAGDDEWLWTVGPATTARSGPKPIVRVDVTTGARSAPALWHGPIALGAQAASSGVWALPESHDLVLVIDEAFVVFDPETGNSFTLSN